MFKDEETIIESEDSDTGIEDQYIVESFEQKKNDSFIDKDILLREHNYMWQIDLKYD